MEKFITWEELSDKQLDAITWFRLNPPRYYKWFYKFYKKYIGTTIFFTIIAVAILGIIYNNTNADFWNLLMGLFFFIMALGLWSLSAFLYKHFYTKKYAKKIGLTLKNWNYLTKGMAWDI